MSLFTQDIHHNTLINNNKVATEKFLVINLGETKNKVKRKLFLCRNCDSHFSETKKTFLENLRKPISLIITVLKARVEGMSVNAITQVYGISKNTLYNWQDRFASLKHVLELYSLSHTFLTLVIEGDETYTKVFKNLPPEDSQGWSILLKDRASRFIMDMKCGKKNKHLFNRIINSLCKYIEVTEDVTLITDGEKRYALTLFEKCYQYYSDGKPGRPQKVLKEGVKVRIKNKSSRTNDNKRARQKYETPVKEHPESHSNLEKSEIHTNMIEGTNSSLRRKISAFIRDCNKYSKSSSSLQTILDIFWIIHNFVNKHFTTKQVPAVSLGILEKGLTFEELFQIRIVKNNK